jgi:hypothetical protein
MLFSQLSYVGKDRGSLAVLNMAPIYRHSYTLNYRLCSNCLHLGHSSGRLLEHGSGFG